MDLRLKKRVVGILLLIGLGLIFIPIFFNRSAPGDEMQLSGDIPRPPAKPHDLGLAIPAEEETMPAPARVKLSGAQQDQSPASRLVSEQVQSVTPDVSASPVNPATPTYVHTPATKTTSSEASTLTAPPAQMATHAGRASSPPAFVSNSASQYTSSSPSSVPVQSMQQPAPTAVSAVPDTTTAKQTTATKAASPAPAAKSQPKTVNKSAVKTPVAWVVQVGSFSDKINANNLVKNLQSKGFAAYSHAIKTANGELIKVLVGPHLQRSDANNVQLKIQQEFNLKGIVVRSET